MAVSAPTTPELRLRRSSVHRQHDIRRLDEGEDLNDALMDFFVKLGQLIIPCGGLEGGFSSVAYLGSLFLDVLKKGGVMDGREGHKNVANWARRRLGEGGMFFDGMGALAVPVNETLRDQYGKSSTKERHWWLALLVNPRGATKPDEEEKTALLCLDSLARANVKCEPPLQAYMPSSPGYQLQVLSLYRQGFSASLRFRACGDGSSGSIVDPRQSTLHSGGREYDRPQVTISSNSHRGSQGNPGRIEGFMEFEISSHSRISGDYALEFGDAKSYLPTPKLKLRRSPCDFQRDTAKFLGGYVAKEWESMATPSSSSKTSAGGENGTAEKAEKGQNGNGKSAYDESRILAGIRLPDVPQQETSNDCGFFILEQMLLALQLTPDGMRTLARASTDMLNTLPWPTQREVTNRKSKLREAVCALFKSADELLCDDVEELLKKSPALRMQVQKCMWDGPRFSEAVRMMAAISTRGKEFTPDELIASTTKQLREMAAQRGILPQGLIERSDLIRVLAPHARKPAPPKKEEPEHSPQDLPENGEPCAKKARTDDREAEPSPSAGSPEPEPQQPQQAPPQQHLGSLRFSVADLEAMPLKTLRGLCVQHKVLPACALERGDFIQALRPLANGSGGAARVAAAAVAHPAQTQAKAAEPAAPQQEETLEERKARWAKSVGAHLAGLTFCLQDLAVMPLKTLKALCSQHGVLPASAISRDDFVEALTPMAKLSIGPGAGGATLASGGNGVSGTGTSHAAGGAASTQVLQPKKETPPPRKDFSRFLGQLKPTFTPTDLEEMPTSTLRTLCMQHGVLPPAGCEASHADLQAALDKLAVRRQTDALMADDDVACDEEIVD